jgi:hypothetical protein
MIVGFSTNVKPKAQEGAFHLYGGNDLAGVCFRQPKTGIGDISALRQKYLTV